jgi:hypothetical protein
MQKTLFVGLDVYEGHDFGDHSGGRPGRGSSVHRRDDQHADKPVETSSTSRQDRAPAEVLLRGRAVTTAVAIAAERRTLAMTTGPSLCLLIAVGKAVADPSVPFRYFRF